MTGRYLLPFCKKLFFRICSLLPLLTASPPPSLCPGTAFLYEPFRYFCFYWYFCFYLYKNHNFFFLNVCFLHTRREVPSLRGDRSQECVHRSEYLNLVSFAWILHSIPYFFTTLFPTTFSLRSRMTGRYLIPFCKNRFFGFAHACPLSST